MFSESDKVMRQRIYNILKSKNNPIELYWK